MGIFSKRPKYVFNSTYIQMRNGKEVPQDVFNGLLKKIIEVLNKNNYIVNEGSIEFKEFVRCDLQDGGYFEFLFVGEGTDRLDIVLESNVSKSEFTDIILPALDQVPVSFGLVLYQDYYGLGHYEMFGRD